MPKKKAEREIKQYAHADKERLNNPPVGLVSEATEHSQGTKKTYQHDPHLDPQLQWAGKTEHTSFAIPTVSLHVHERIDPKTIIENAKRKEEGPKQYSLFEVEKKPLREAIEFYKHKQGWTNRLIAGDSLLVMNSLLEKEGMGGKVQMIYFDPPYGIKYGSNFQPFTNKRDVKDGKDEDLSAEPEMIKAFRDTSRVAVTLAKQRLMTAAFDYYKLAHPNEGVGSGFAYKTAPHITLKSIANNEPPATETLYDQPLKDNKKARVTGPFTVEAVPAPRALSLEEVEQENQGSGENVTRSGETARQAQWRDELLRTGVRAKGGRMIHFIRVEPMGGTRWIQAEAETKDDVPKKVLVVFGPEHAPLEQRTVENAWQESRAFSPDMLLFCAFQFDNEAAKDIDELKPEVAGMQLLKAQMNADLFTDDLKKKRASNESFWLIGQPDVVVNTVKDGEDAGKYQVTVLGFDYYNPLTGNVESGGQNKIAMWLLDTNYDERSLFPSQVFFPMAGAKEGWSKLAKNLKAEIDEEKIEAFRGTVSLPFEKGNNAKIAVKIIDDRGIESLRVIALD